MEASTDLISDLVIAGLIAALLIAAAVASLLLGALCELAIFAVQKLRHRKARR